MFRFDRWIRGDIVSPDDSRDYTPILDRSLFVALAATSGAETESAESFNQIDSLDVRALIQAASGSKTDTENHASDEDI